MTSVIGSESSPGLREVVADDRRRSPSRCSRRRTARLEVRVVGFCDAPRRRRASGRRVGLVESPATRSRRARSGGRRRSGRRCRSSGERHVLDVVERRRGVRRRPRPRPGRPDRRRSASSCWHEARLSLGGLLEAASRMPARPGGLADDESSTSSLRRCRSTVPTAKTTTTNASQPKIAVLRCVGAPAAHAGRDVVRRRRGLGRASPGAGSRLGLALDDARPHDSLLGRGVTVQPPTREPAAAIGGMTCRLGGAGFWRVARVRSAGTAAPPARGATRCRSTAARACRRCSRRTSRRRAA